MKAIRLHEQGKIDVIKIDEIPIPTVKENEVLVRIKAAALNHLDLFVRRGIPGTPLPIIPGSDGAGIIEVTGDEVIIVPFRTCQKCDKCLIGEEQLCRQYQIPGEHLDGTMAEYIAVPKNYILPKPGNLTWEEAAAFPLAFLTAYHMLVKKVQIKKSDRGFIWGASSGIGSAAVQIAKHFGAKVITTAGTDEKIEFAKKLGADFVLNYKTENIANHVKEITEGQGIDIVFEHPGRQTWNDSLRMLNKGGRIVSCGATTGPKVELDLRHLFMKHQQIIGSTMGNKKDLTEIIDLINSGKIKPYVGHSFHFTEIKKAHQVLENGQQIGKMVINFVL